MNKWGCVRWVILLAAVVLTLWSGPFQGHSEPPMDIRSLIFILGATPLGLLFVISLQPLNRRTDRQWAIPAWAQNPFNIKQPLQFFHFAAFFFLATGFASVARLIITGPEYLYESLVPLAVGAGLLIGLYLSTVLYRSRMESPVHH